MPNYEEIIQQSQENVKALSEKLKDLEKLHQEIKALKEAAEGIPESFNTKFQELVNLSEDYTNTLGAATQNYLDGNNTLFTTKLSELSTKIKDLEKQITRLVNTDLITLFKGFQKSLIDETRKSLDIKFNHFDEKLKVFQTIVNELKKLIERITNIEFKESFEKIEELINALILNLNIVNDNLLEIQKQILESIGTMHEVIETNHKDSKQQINNFSLSISKSLANQDKLASENIKLLLNNIQSLSAQNDLLKKVVKVIGIIQIVGITIILIILLYVAVKH